jgi:HTH-type transcriptional regulator/antitoxin HigA
MSGRLKVVQASEAKMSAVIERHLDLKSVQSAWKELTKLVPLGPITGKKDYEQRVRVMDELLERIGSDESHPLMPLLDLLTKQIEAYEQEHHNLPDATPAEVLQYLMEEHDLKQTDLAEELRRTERRVRHLEWQTRTEYAPSESAGNTLQRLAGGLPLNFNSVRRWQLRKLPFVIS